MLTATGLDDTVDWYENDGAESFTKHTLSDKSSSSAYAMKARTADVDGDGDLDVVAAWALGDDVTWHENDGSMGFTDHDVGVLDYAFFVEGVDLDLDGDVDDGLSLEDLMAQLTTAQETKSTARLSERNVVELVSKLREKGLIGSEENNALLYTVTGREYLMERKLREEVREAN